MASRALSLFLDRCFCTRLRLSRIIKFARNKFSVYRVRELSLFQRGERVLFSMWLPSCGPKRLIEMSKQAKPSASRARAEDTSGAGVLDREITDVVNPSELEQEHSARKEEQKHRVEELDKDLLLNLLYQM